jgi:hypothetical protein
VTGLTDANRCRATLSACAACCRTFPPTVEVVNGVVASLLFAVASETLSRGGAPGCDAPRAAALRRRATAALAVAEGGSSPLAGRPYPSAPSRLAARIRSPQRTPPARPIAWAVGVTTAPRDRPTLDECLASLARAGWSNPRLFVDADAPVPGRAAALPRTTRHDRAGAWPNYLLALHELVLREPRADAFMLVQDDCAFHDDESLRDYLERHVLWPEPGPGVVSLYCASAYTRPEAGWHALEQPWGWGALAFVFPNAVARAILLDAGVFEHRRTGRSHGLAHIDVVIGSWAARRGVPIWFPCPSLVQHVGEVSSLWSGARAAGDRRASWFAGDPVRP